MKELSTHIEYLLLSHDCVVVPQFGAFMAMEASASRSDEEQLFFPPLRRVRFNADVTEDDGLLVASVSHTHGIDGSRAKHRVQTMVLNLRQQLLADGQVDFGSIGIFTQDEDGHVQFSACQAGSVSPALYGLDAFVMPKVALSYKGTRARGRHRHLTGNDVDNHITIHISRRTLRHALTTAAAVLLCLALSVPLRDSTNGNTRLASIAQTTVAANKGKHATAQPVATNNKPQASQPKQQAQQPKTQAPTTTTPTPAPTTTTPTPAPTPTLAPTPKAPTPAPTTSTSTPQTSHQPQQASPSTPKATTADTAATAANGDMKAPSAYAVVLASATNRANASALVERLHGMGYANARIYDNGRLKRVILDGYTTEELALNAKRTLQRSHDGFDDAWLLRQ